MKKVLIAVAVVASLALVTSASAQSISNSNSHSQSASQAIGAITNPTANSQGIGVGQVTLKQSFAGSNIPANIPAVQMPMGRVPEIFGPSGQPTVMAGVPLIEWYNAVTRPVATRAHRLADIRAEGDSGLTSIVFSPHQDYYLGAVEKTAHKYVDSGNVGNPTNASFPWSLPSSPSRTVSVSTSTSDVLVNTVQSLPGSGMYVPLGVVTVEVTAKTGGVPFTTVRSDVANYIFDHLKGWKNVYILTNSGAVGGTASVSNSGHDLSLVGSGISFALNRATGGVLGAGISGGNGTTRVNARLGTTYLLFAPANGNNGIDVEISSLRKVYRHEKK